MKFTSSKEAIRAVKDYCNTYGCPRRVVSGRGLAFSSAEFGEWANSNGVKHVQIVRRVQGKMDRWKI